MKKQNLSRVLSMLLVLCMLFTSLPVRVWAEGNANANANPPAPITEDGTTVSDEPTEEPTETPLEQLQEMINALPTSVTEDNRDSVIAQLEAIDEAKLLLSDEDYDSIDWSNYEAAAIALGESYEVEELDKYHKMNIHFIEGEPGKDKHTEICVVSEKVFLEWKGNFINERVRVYYKGNGGKSVLGALGVEDSSQLSGVSSKLNDYKLTGKWDKSELSSWSTNTYLEHNDNVLNNVYLQVEPKTYTLILDANEGKIDGKDKKEITTKVDSGLNTTYVPNRDDYQFVGWFTEKKGGTQVTSWDGKSNKTLYAHWQQEHSITVNTDGHGTASASASSAKKDTEITVTATPNTGYKFKNWESSTVTVANNKFTMPDKNVTVKANFEPIKYKVKFNAKGGTGTMADMTFDYDQELPLTACGFSKTNHQFLGWSTNPDASTPDEGLSDGATVKNLASSDNAVVNLYAVWEQNAFTLTLNANGGTIATATVTKEKDTVVPNLDTTYVPSRSGFKFLGWYDETVTPAVEVKSWTATVDKTLTAHWQQLYKVTVNASSNGSVSADKTADLEGNETITLTVAANSGYYLKSLTVKNGETEISTTKNADGTYSFTMPAADVTVTAEFEANSHEAELKIYFGTGKGDVWSLVDTADKCKLDCYHADNNFHSLYWEDNTSLGVGGVKNYIIDNNLVPSGYRLTGEWGKGTADIAAQTTITRQNAGDCFASQVSIYVQVEAIRITFDANDGNWDGSTDPEVRLWLTDTVPTNPSRENYKFVGWEDEDGNVVTNLEANTALKTALSGAKDNATYKAKWERVYKITVQSLDGETTIPNGSVTVSPKTNNLDGGETITLTIKANAGYHFTSLNIQYQGTKAMETIIATEGENDTWTFTMPKADVTVKVGFGQPAMRVNTKYEIGTGKGDTWSLLTSGTMAVTCFANTDGYHYLYWEDQANHYELKGQKYDVRGVKTDVQGRVPFGYQLTELWAKDHVYLEKQASVRRLNQGDCFATQPQICVQVEKIEITFDAGEGEWDENESMKKVPLASGKVPADPSRDGYTFAGWENKEGWLPLKADDVLKDTLTNVYDDTTYKARWVINPTAALIANLDAFTIECEHLDAEPTHKETYKFSEMTIDADYTINDVVVNGETVTCVVQLKYGADGILALADGFDEKYGLHECVLYPRSVTLVYENGQWKNRSETAADARNQDNSQEQVPSSVPVYYVRCLVKPTVTVIWNDDNNYDKLRPEELTVYLNLKDSEDETVARLGSTLNTLDTKVLVEAKNWADVFEAQYKYSFTDSQSVLNEFEVVLDSVPNGYDVEYKQNGYNFEIVLSHKSSRPTYVVDNSDDKQEDKVIVKVKWYNDREGDRPDDISVQLLKNGKNYGKVATLSDSKNSSKNWRHVWEDVNETDDTVWSIKVGNIPSTYSYTIEEVRSNYFVIHCTLKSGKANPETGFGF